MSRFAHGLMWVTPLLATVGCFPAKAPLKTTMHEGADDTRTLVVMLPGFGAHDTTLDKNGVIPAAREAGLEADILAADLTYGYYISETWEDRMREDVFDVYASQYDHIWVMGISMGGMGSLLTAKTFAEHVDGVVLFSPFLGRKKTLRAIQEQGLERWVAPLEDPMWDEALWTHMQQWNRRGFSQPPLFLGHGDKDLGMRNLEWMQGLLPEDRVEVTAGGHTWPVWSELMGVFVRDHLVGRWEAFGKPPTVPVVPDPVASEDTDSADSDEGASDPSTDSDAG